MMGQTTRFRRWYAKAVNIMGWQARCRGHDGPIQTSNGVTSSSNNKFESGEDEGKFESKGLPPNGEGTRLTGTRPGFWWICEATGEFESADEALGPTAGQGGEHRYAG
ncbi:hypothetical protein PILCRDRAFT_223885 [Piloderma croceum F 1598]|uniref:Uncharacterized protein n=1 Tax=Piloderma croceum (strain F 1598) TaxID=765440 RepID=A0A0C3BSA1_PILCF|nr:hypothetical protein PILCRDRAFT_223885 [Piloderma croceum F 1598]